MLTNIHICRNTYNIFDIFIYICIARGLTFARNPRNSTQSAVLFPCVFFAHCEHAKYWYYLRLKHVCAYLRRCQNEDWSGIKHQKKIAKRTQCHRWGELLTVDILPWEWIAGEPWQGPMQIGLRILLLICPGVLLAQGALANGSGTGGSLIYIYLPHNRAITPPDVPMKQRRAQLCPWAAEGAAASCCCCWCFLPLAAFTFAAALVDTACSMAVTAKCHHIVKAAEAFHLLKVSQRYPPQFAVFGAANWDLNRPQEFERTLK